MQKEDWLKMTERISIEKLLKNPEDLFKISAQDLVESFLEDPEVLSAKFDEKTKTFHVKTRKEGSFEFKFALKKEARGNT